MKHERVIKYVATGLTVLFCIVTTVKVAVSGRTDRILLSAWTILLSLLPLLLEKVFSCRLSLPFYICLQLYVLGPMLGHCWRLYYYTAWWDKLLHISAGVIFVILGAFFFEMLTRGKQRPLAIAVFALCFSVAISGLWELFEFGTDQLLGQDMQNDRIITRISSYALGGTPGTVGTIDPIRSVVVNGKTMAGYLDIGLIDSMLDMLVETAGALVTALLIWWDRGRHPCIKRNRQA